MRSTLVAFFLIFGLISCANRDLATLPTGQPISSAKDGQIQPLCILGCNDPDPAPDSAGYYIAGARFTWAGCTDPDIDIDQDGLLDDCELALVGAFAPLLSFGDADDVRRESRWAARPEDGQTVLIAYLFSYYLDMGDPGASTFFCYYGWWGCFGHNGDSEAAVLTVKYNSNTHHWYLVGMSLSRHTYFDDFYKVPGADALFHVGYGDEAAFAEFSDKPLGYPTIWVANGKHANYGSHAACNSGQGGPIPDTDDCDGSRTWVRFGFAFDSYIGLAYDSNIGSRWHPLIDCVGPVNPDHPAYSQHNQECYWTDKRFEGWFAPTSDGPVSSYSSILSRFGF